MKRGYLPRLLVGPLLAVLVLLAAGQGWSRDDAKKLAKFRVKLPDSEEEVVVQIDGKTVSEDGDPVRTVEAPALAKGKKQHAVTAIWLTNNYTMFLRTRMVAPRPGET